MYMHVSCLSIIHEGLVHDFELGDQIVAVNATPVGCSMELCRAIYMATQAGGDVNGNAGNSERIDS